MAQVGGVMRATLVILGLVLTVAGAAAAPRESTILSGGRILASIEDSAGTATARWTDAVLVHDGRIAAVGSLAEVDREARRLGAHPRRVPVAGRFAMAGLCDAHGHVAGLGLALERLRFQNTTSAEQIAAMVAAEAKQRPKGAWILGRGWDQNDWAVKEFPTRELLDRVAPDHPVWLRRVDGHAAWANSKALALAGVTNATVDPSGGRILRRSDGSPAGVLVDNAMALVERAIAPPTRAETRAAILRALHHCRQFGLTAVHDAGIDSEGVAIYRELAGRGELPVRVFAMLAAGTAQRPGMLPREKVAAGDGMFRVFAVKAYADGALGSRGAALLADYSDDAGNTGLVRTPEEELERIAQGCLAAGYQMCTHAIGDRGNRFTIEAYESAASRTPGVSLRDRRFRIEHAQVLALPDIERMARDGIIASMQPTHCTSDMPWAPVRLGPERVEGAYAWRRILTAGGRLALGSDFPVESDDPRLGLYAAVTTQAPDGTPPGGFRPSERLTALEALRGFTSDAAYAAFAEHEVGKLAVGLRADLTVWDRDLTVVPARELLSAKPVMTMVQGTLVRQ